MDTIPSKNSVGSLEWIDKSQVSGPQGPAGPPGSLAVFDVADSSNPVELSTISDDDFGLEVIVREVVPGSIDVQTLYVYDADASAILIDGLYAVATSKGGNSRWIAGTGAYGYAGVISTATGERFISRNEIHSLGINSSTGIHSGGIPSINVDTTKIDISDGSGLIVNSYDDPDATDYKDVEWTGLTGITLDNLLTSPVTYLALEAGIFNPATGKYSATVVQKTTPFTREETRDYILCGIAIHTQNVVVESVSNSVRFSAAPFNQLVDLASAIGQINISGNVFSANGANLNLNKSAGSTYSTGANYDTSKKDPNVVTNPSETNVMWFYNYRAVSGPNNIILNQVSIDPAQYDDDSGVLQPVGNNEWTIQPIFFSSVGETVIQYGQVKYGSLALAEEGIRDAIEIDPALQSINIRGWLIVKGNATDLSNPAQAKFIEAGKFGSSTASSQSSSTTNQQQAYNNSTPNPEILTDATNGAMTYRRGSAAESDDVIEMQKNDGTQTFAVKGDGEISTDGQAYSKLNTLTDQALITTDCSLGNVHKVTLAGNRTLVNPTNLRAGATYIWLIDQDAVGSRVITFDTLFQFPDGADKVLSTAVNAKDVLTGVYDGSFLRCSLAKDFK